MCFKVNIVMFENMANIVAVMTIGPYFSRLERGFLSFGSLKVGRLALSCS